MRCASASGSGWASSAIAKRRRRSRRRWRSSRLRRRARSEIRARSTLAVPHRGQGRAARRQRAPRGGGRPSVQRRPTSTCAMTRRSGPRSCLPGCRRAARCAYACVRARPRGRRDRRRARMPPRHRALPALARAFDPPRAGRSRRPDDLMSDDLQTLLRPLRELEPTSEELARARAAARDHPLGAPVDGAAGCRGSRSAARGWRWSEPPRSRSRWPSRSCRPATTARCAARSGPRRRAAAVEPPCAPPLTGYRHIVERVHVQSPGSAPRSTSARSGSTRSGVASSACDGKTTPVGPPRSRGKSATRRSRSCRPIPTRCWGPPPRTTTAATRRGHGRHGRSSDRCPAPTAAGSEMAMGPPG